MYKLKVFNDGINGCADEKFNKTKIVKVDDYTYITSDNDKTRHIFKHGIYIGWYHPNPTEKQMEDLLA